MGIKFRIDGVLTQAMPPIGKEHHSTIISRIKVMSELDISERRVPQDGRFRVKYGRPSGPSISVFPSCLRFTAKMPSSACSTKNR